MKPPNCTAKELFAIKESHSFVTRIKQKNAEYKKINLKSTILNLNYLKDRDKNSLLELLLKHENMFDGTFGKYTGSDYIVELKKMQSLIIQNLFLFKQFTASERS